MINSRQIGKKMITKGHQKICIDIENIRYIQHNGVGLATIYLNDNTSVCDIKTLTEFEDAFLRTDTPSSHKYSPCCGCLVCYMAFY